LAAAIKRWVAPIGGSNQKVGGTDWRSIDCRQHRFSTPNSGSTRYRHRTPRMGVSFSEGGWHRLAVEALDQNHPDNPKPQKSQKPPDHSSTSCPPSSKGGWHRLAAAIIKRWVAPIGGRSKGGWHRLAVGRLSTANSGSTRYRHRTPRMGVSFSKGGWHRLAVKRWVAPIVGQKVGGTD